MVEKKTKLFARELRKNQTDAENKVWRELRNRRFSNLKFRRQYVVGPYVVDFCCPEKKLIIEIDGSQHKLQKSYDDERLKYLELNDYEVMRFWNNDVLEKCESVLNLIYQKVNPHPSPLPGRERGNFSSKV